ncbi:MAG TPA: c-type cytochrome [Bryobacteraceae bacterium]|jgi:mono/diheme cytochrome c family protein|nr:c-type cytochrome [Bryobacteraceae bacterium]
MRYAKLAILSINIAVGLVASAQTPDRTSPRSTAAGKELFHQNCSICHGVDAKGYGSMYDPNSAEASRRVPPADLTVLSQQNAGKFPAAHIRDAVDMKGSVPAHGTPDMPAWGHAFDTMKFNQKRFEENIRNLTAYIESIQDPKK